jgi:UDPglucose 6-dehydrogenase
MAPSALDALAGADAAVLVTEWKQLVQMDWAAARERMRTPVVIDGRNALDPARMADLGFLMEGIGRLPSAVDSPAATAKA